MRYLRHGVLWLFGYREIPFAVRGLFSKEAVHMSAWISSRVVLGVGLWLSSLTLVGIGLTMGGLALAGGRFSWQLGHMAFSESHNDATYMGIHQALTGVRSGLLWRKKSRASQVGNTGPLKGDTTAST